MNGIVISVQRSWKVEEVTSAKDEPPSMFVLEELCGMARGSAVDANGIAQQLIKKLNNPQPIVKAKALKAIKVLAQKGGQQFQKSISRHSTQIREMMRYSGPPDQFMGDVLNQRVRDAAGEAIEAIFNPQSQQPSSAVSSDSTNIKDRIKGIGGTDHVMSSGFSNPTLPAAFSAPPANSAAKRSVYDKTPIPIGTGKKMEGFGNTSISYEQSFPSSEIPASSAANNQWNLPQRTFQRTESSGSYNEVVKLPGSFNFRNDPASAVKTVGSEEQIVDEICTPGGIRAAPSSEDLKRFVEKVSVLDGDKIAAYLETKITDARWQTKLRALCGLEAVMNFGSTESCMMVVQHFIINPESIEKCRQNQQMSVKERANQIYQIIGAEHPEQNGNSKQQSTENQSVDLLADLGGNSAVQAAPANGNVAAADPFGMLDMNMGGAGMTQNQQTTGAQLQQGGFQQGGGGGGGGAGMSKTVSNELSGLTIIDTTPIDNTNNLAALDEALFTASPVQPAIPQQQQGSQFPMMPQQPMVVQQQMQSVPPTQYATQQYGIAQMGGLQYMPQAQPAMMMAQPGMQQTPPAVMVGQMQPAQFQQQQQYSMLNTTMPQTQSGGPMSPMSPNSGKIVTPSKGKVKKDAAFDFVQDHMAGLSKK